MPNRVLAGLSRWVREGPPANLVPTRFGARLEAVTVSRAYPRLPMPLHWSLPGGPARAGMLFGGDLSLHRWQSGDPPEPVFSGLAGLVGSSDALIVNLESQITSRTTPAGTIGSSLRAVPGAIDVLGHLGVTAVTCANNHCLDFGSDGLEDSVQRLGRAGIAVSGVVRDGSDGGVILPIRGIKVGLLGFTDDWRAGSEAADGCRPAEHDPVMIRARIAAMQGASDLVIVQLHWGYEWSMYPMLTLRDLARSYVEAGASLVICHHAHVPMGIEAWRGGAIAHGLGNLYFGPRSRADHPFKSASFLLRAGLSSHGVVDLTIVPVTTDSAGRVGPAAGPTGGLIERSMAYLSGHLGHDGYLGKVEASLSARQACVVLLDLARRVAGGDHAGVTERIRFLETPRQQDLIEHLRRAGGLLERIGNLCQAARAEGGVGSPALRAELESLSPACARYLDQSRQLGRIP